MNTPRYIIARHQSNFNRILRHRSLHSSFRHSSTTSVTTESLEFEDDIRDVQPRILRRKPPIPPFMKDIFFGKFNKELLAFPEILNKKELESLSKCVEEVENTILNKSLSEEEIISNLKRKRIFGAPVTAFLGGLEVISTERCRIMEALGHDFKIAKRIRNHWTGIDCIKSAYEEKELRDIIEPFVCGDTPVNIAIFEEDVTSINTPDIRTMAAPISATEWVLNGKKIFYGDERDNGYVFVLSQNNRGTLESFMTSPSASGIQIKPPFITFHNTPATLLGRQIDDIEKSTEMIIFNSLDQNRLESSAIALSLLRNTIQDVVQFCRNKYSRGKPFFEIETVQDAMCEAIITAYALESMIYFTAGLADGYEQPNFHMESILCKIYASTKTFDAINNLVSSLESYNMPVHLIKHMDDARELFLSTEHTNKLHIHLALTGLQHVGSLIQEEVSQIRNPLSYPGFIFKKVFKNRDQEADDPKLNLFLHEELHPSLQDAAHAIEYCVLRMKYASEILLSRHGSNIENEYRFLKRLSLAAVEVYSGVASISRASRSYCIGLHLSEHELIAANYACVYAKSKVRELIRDIDHDMYLNNDCVRGKIGETTFEKRKLYLEHCLNRVYF